MGLAIIWMGNVNVSPASPVSSVRIPVGKEPTDEDVWESVTVQTTLRYVISFHVNDLHNGIFKLNHPTALIYKVTEFKIQWNLDIVDLKIVEFLVLVNKTMLTIFLLSEKPLKFKTILQNVSDDFIQIVTLMS